MLQYWTSAATTSENSELKTCAQFWTSSPVGRGLIKRLIDLNIEDNKLGDRNIIQLLNSLVTNKTVRKLNLSKNFISDFSAEPLRNMLKGNEDIQELYLHWVFHL